MDPTRRDSFQFRENNPLTQENELKEVTSDEAQKFMKQAIKQNKHRDSTILTFQVDRTDSARRCMDLFKDKISLKGYTLDVVGSRHDLPDNIRRGYDYDDPALWRSDLYNVYISK